MTVPRVLTYDEVYGVDGDVPEWREVENEPEEVPPPDRDPGDEGPAQPGLRSRSPLLSHGAWPTLDPAALHGPIGEFVREAAPHTEADPAAILASLVTAFGAACGRGPHMLAGDGRHPPTCFTLIVGDTSKAGKGTSWAVARRVVERATSGNALHTAGGFGSGEAFVDAVRDPRGDDDTDAPKDSRLLVVEPEFARVLSVISRTGDTLGVNLRNAWDGYRLEARSRGLGITVASNYHLAVIAHITAPELRAKLTTTEPGSTVAVGVTVRASN